MSIEGGFLVGGGERGREQFLFNFNECLVLLQGNVIYNLWYVRDKVNKKNVNLEFVIGKKRVKFLVEYRAVREARVDHSVSKSDMKLLIRCVMLNFSPTIENTVFICPTSSIAVLW